MYKIEMDSDNLINKISGERFTVKYEIYGTEDEAYEKARDICFEQTVEFPADLIPEGPIFDSIVGRIESLVKKNESQMSFDGKNVYVVEISFAVETASCELTQLLNVIFGNISIKPNIRVVGINLLHAVLKFFKGPRFGISGLRDYLNIYDRPLTATALKPMGLSSKELAGLAYQFALGGIDIIKDDHGLSNQVFSTFDERVALCAEAVEKANLKTGRRSVYCANITAPADKMILRAKTAKELGAKALMVSPGLSGFDFLRCIADDDSINLPLFSHPSFQGTYVLGGNGISHYCLFGQLNRLAGSDAVIYPNFGGRFSFSKSECEDIVLGTQVNMEHIRNSFPAPGGGMNLHNISDMTKVYGKDVIYLMGGGIFKIGDNLVKNCEILLNKIAGG